MGLWNTGSGCSAKESGVPDLECEPDEQGLGTVGLGKGLLGQCENKTRTQESAPDSGGEGDSYRLLPPTFSVSSVKTKHSLY